MLMISSKYVFIFFSISNVKTLKKMEAYGITLEWPNVENLTYMYIIETVTVTVTVANSGMPIHMNTCYIAKRHLGA